MTAIVAIEHDGKVYMGCDSAGLINDSWDMRARHPDDPKIITYPNRQLIMGCAGSRRWCSAIADYFTPPQPSETENESNRAYVARLANELREFAKEYGILSTETPQQVNSLMLIGYRGVLYEVDGDFALAKPLHPYGAIGCGDQVALGTLFGLERVVGAYEHLKIEQKLIIALEASEQFSAGVRAPFVVKSA